MEKVAKACSHKDDNYNMVIKSPHHNYNTNGKEERYQWIHFQNDFFQMINVHTKNDNYNDYISVYTCAQYCCVL